MSRRDRSGRDATVVVLAVGLVVAINCLTIAALYDAIVSSQSGLSENATQILTTAFGGIIGVLGSVLGYKVGTQASDELATKNERQTTVTETPDQPSSPDVESVRPVPEANPVQDVVDDDDTSDEPDEIVAGQDDAKAPDAG